jgi:hypothetical protein
MPKMLVLRVGTIILEVLPLSNAINLGSHCYIFSTFSRDYIFIFDVGRIDFTL